MARVSKDLGKRIEDLQALLDQALAEKAEADKVVMAEQNEQIITVIRRHIDANFRDLNDANFVSQIKAILAPKAEKKTRRSKTTAPPAATPEAPKADAKAKK